DRIDTIAPLPPFERVAAYLPKDRKDSNTGGHRPEGAPVEDMELRPFAELACVLGRGRLEALRPKPAPGQPEAIQPLRQRLRLKPRRAKVLERLRRAAPFGEVRPLDQAGPGVDERRVRRRHVGRRRDPGTAQVMPVLLPPPPLRERDVRLVTHAEAAMEQNRELGHGAAA